MRSLRKMTKADKLLNMFDEVGKKIPIDKVCEETGFKNYNSLKAVLSYIRKSSYVMEESRIDIRLKNGNCERVK